MSHTTLAGAESKERTYRNNSKITKKTVQKKYLFNTDRLSERICNLGYGTFLTVLRIITQYLAITVTPYGHHIWQRWGDKSLLAFSQKKVSASR